MMGLWRYFMLPGQDPQDRRGVARPLRTRLPARTVVQLAQAVSRLDAELVTIPRGV